MKRNSPEHKFQVALIDYLKIAGRPELHWFAVPNGGYRAKTEAMRLKNEGVRSGTPDLCFMLPDGKVAWLEMKATKGTLGPAQKEFRDIAYRLGHHWGVAKTIDEALEFLTSIDALKPAYQCVDAYREAAKIHISMMGVA